MADPQDSPNTGPDGVVTPPAQQPPAKIPAKKASAKKTPEKKAPPQKAPASGPLPAPPKPPQAQHDQQPQPAVEIAAAAKDAAAQAKSAIDRANAPVSADLPRSIGAQSALPVAVAVALSLLAILLIRQLRRH
ncbi:Rv3852 family protein [Mycobacterium tilburgii]|uniref:Rv3852 family protein n=1 Tax=Mycobacterium tilburgii TaxID=44467 RepID=UPI001181EA17|nr:nucleoid-structuring protein H-NS [Mycobacterium tilburgii]